LSFLKGIEQTLNPLFSNPFNFKQYLPVTLSVFFMIKTEIKEDLFILQDALNCLLDGFSDLPCYQTDSFITDEIRTVLLETAKRMQDNYPYHHPLYAGQMLKPPSRVARLAYILSLWINPNNHALEGGKASSAMEKKAVGKIAEMFGFDSYLGHLTSGGTMANLEALWVSGQISNKGLVVASAQAHYTHSRICGVLGLSFQEVPCDKNARMDIEKLEEILQNNTVDVVVATLGSTATGSVDPLFKILALQSKYKFRIHVDAAYGGYFTLANNLSDYNKASYEVISQADSIVIDPHKHGLQPYGCGCVLFKDDSVGQFYKHDSPYTYFSSAELHLGEISLECSRAGASAVALWATQKIMPLQKGSKFALNLEDSRAAALHFHHKIKESEFFIAGFEPDLDIVFWVPKAKTIQEMSNLSREIFKVCAEKNLYFALAEMPISFFYDEIERKNLSVAGTEKTITTLRSCLMKPEHLKWIDEIFVILKNAAISVQNQIR
jgi:tyrosine decarboxylase / aspartate 1-decarboxylase